MSEPTPFALASVPAGSTDPRLLTMHLDICRMRAELEILEGRIGRIRAGEAEAAADSRPFVDRAQELVDRTVASLLEAGRAEIEAADRRSVSDAEARMAEANRQARLLITAAREELAAALTERADAAERSRGPAADVVILPDEGLVVLPGDDLVVLPDDGLVVLPGDDAVMAPTDGLVVLPGDDVVLVLPEQEAITPVAAEAAVAAALVAEPAVLAASEPLVGSAPVPSPLPTTPPPAPVVSLAPIDSGSGPTEASPADVAFDVWLSMAPPAPAPATPGSAGQSSESPAKARPRWLRPLEAAAALMLVALVVAVSLVLVG